MIESRQPHSGNDLDISTNTNKAGRTQWSFPLSRVPESFEDETESNNLHQTHTESLIDVTEGLLNNIDYLWKKLPRNIVDKVKYIAKAMMMTVLNTSNKSQVENSTYM